MILPPEVQSAVYNIIKAGNNAEVKKVNGKIEVIEIKRKKKAEALFKREEVKGQLGLFD